MLLTKLTLIEVGDLEEQYRRPFKFSTDGDVLNSIESLVLSSGGNLSNDLFISTAADALRLSSDSEDVGIAGNVGRRAWREKRYRFIAEVELESFSARRRTASRAVVIGYTDRVDLSHNQLVADDLQMYVNSVVVIRDIELTDRRGNPYIKSKLVDSQQALLGDIDFDRGNVDYMMRPFDLFNTVDTHRDTGRADDHIDYRCLFQHGVQLNSRNSNDSNRYLSRVVTADRQGLGNLETYADVIMESSRETEAADILRPSQLDSNLFLKAIASRSDYADNNYFDYQDLATFTPRGTMDDLDDVTKIVPMASNLLSYESEEWHGASPETMAAIQVCHAIPIIMLDCLFSYVAFTVSNRHSADNRVEFLIDDMTSYAGEGFDDRQVFNTFESRAIREVFNVISANGYFDVRLEVSSEVGGMTRIELQIDDGPSTPYVFPSFADAMISPVITRDKNILDDNAENYIKLRDVVDDAINNCGRIDTTSRLRNGRVESAERNRPRNTGIDLLDIDRPRRDTRSNSDDDLSSRRPKIDLI